MLRTKDIEPYERLGVAVSGGGDSLALLVLLVEWAFGRGVKLQAVTLDHKLRPGSADEARFAGALAAKLAIPHDILEWSDHAKGNLPDQARRARLKLLGDWGHKKGLQAICLGHTADDVAETFLMRLARGAGVDGLAAMQAMRNIDGIAWIRPLINTRRAQLRAFLSARGISWCEDPSNDDTCFERTRIRNALGALEALGLGVDTLHKTASHLRAASDSLSHQASLWIGAHALLDRGEIRMSAEDFRALGEEMRFRILSGLLKWLGQSEYGPRGRSVLEVLARINEGQSRSLCGCMVIPSRGQIILTREAARQPIIAAKAGKEQIYDGLWQVMVERIPRVSEHILAPVGALGLCEFENWRQSGLSKYGAMATPGLWRDRVLIAAPILVASKKLNAAFSKNAPKALFGSFLL